MAGVVSAKTARTPPTTAAKAPVHRVLSMWLSPTGTAMVKKDLAQFEKRNPGITVSLESLSWQAYNQKITTELAGGAGPDVVEIPFESWIYSGFVRNLEPYMKADSSFKIHHYYKVGRDYSRYNHKFFGTGAYYGLP